MQHTIDNAQYAQCFVIAVVRSCYIFLNIFLCLNFLMRVCVCIRVFYFILYQCALCLLLRGLLIHAHFVSSIRRSLLLYCIKKKKIYLVARLVRILNNLKRYFGRDDILGKGSCHWG